MASLAKRMRCAVYTRKSTEEGLEKAFNSLDAQREACAAYVLSQQHEGWELSPEIYDDGGYSGGSMDRPALRQLLADVKAGRVDIVVVYKIDRLTRSLADFARIVDVLDAAGASFVSVTQAFSTTTSMGRLTLNVLLSFAQFEREVIAERIRDKVAASKARGMWMGGPVSLGYEVRDRKLKIVPEEAARVRHIMQRYLEVDSIRTLVEVLQVDGIVSKRRVMRDGSVKGGVPFRRGAIAWLLSNQIYIGRIVHKGTTYSGEHEAIVEQELFDAVQARLAERTASDAPIHQRRVSLLAGMIRDERNRPMLPSHTRNHGRRYSYYSSSMNDDASAAALRLPAGELETSVRRAICDWLRDGDALRRLVEGCSADEVTRLFEGASQLAGTVETGSIVAARAVLARLELSVSVRTDGITATVNPAPILVDAGMTSEEALEVSLAIPTASASYGHEPRLRLAPTGGTPAARDERLVELVARAFAARDHLITIDEDIAEVPVSRVRHLQRQAKLAYLDPDIIRAILTGSQPRGLGARELWRMGELPLTWAEQRSALGFAAA